jgi:hypothetical protein
MSFLWDATLPPGVSQRCSASFAQLGQATVGFVAGSVSWWEGIAVVGSSSASSCFAWSTSAVAAMSSPMDSK